VFRYENLLFHMDSFYRLLIQKSSPAECLARCHNHASFQSASAMTALIPGRHPMHKKWIERRLIRIHLFSALNFF
jgi:hypothetical protein